MIRVHREPLVPLFLFDWLPVPGRDEERNDNASTSPTVADESESGRRDVPARHCEGYRTKGFAVVLTKRETQDRKSTRLNSSHLVISYAVFCLKKKKKKKHN